MNPSLLIGTIATFAIGMAVGMGLTLAYLHWRIKRIPRYRGPHVHWTPR